MSAARITCAALIAVAASAPRPAAADAEESSLGVRPLGGAVRAGDDNAFDTATAPVFGLGLTFSYATRDTFAFEIDVAVADSAEASFVELRSTDLGDELRRKTRLARAGGGLTARLGVRYIPTLCLGGGLLYRSAHGGSVLRDGATVAVLDADTSLGAYVTAGAGFDIRFDRHWIAGLGLRATRGFAGPALDSLEAGLHLSYYWYPRWF